jgi:hypothetical protein
MGNTTNTFSLPDSLGLLRAETSKLLTGPALAESVAACEREARPHLHGLMSYFVASDKLSFELEDQLWLTVYRYLKYLIQQIDAVQKSAVGESDSGHSAASCSLKIEAMVTMAKWHYLRYRPLPRHFWRNMHATYAQFERLHEQNPAATLTASPAVKTRYLQALLLDSINRSNMQKREIDHVDHWLHGCCQSITLERQCNELKHLLFVDLTSERSAQRIREYETLPNCRYWSMESIIAQLVEMRIQVEQGVIPAIFSQDTGLPNAKRLLDQLSGEWSYQSYKRQRRTDEREEVAKLAQAVHGIMNVCQHIKNNAYNQMAAPMRNLLRPENSWRIENESKFGFGAQVNMGMNLWLKPGCLISLDYELNPDLIVVGVVRNIQQQQGADCYAGIEVLSHMPSYVTLRAMDDNPITTASPALYLPRDDERHLPASLVMALHDYVARGRYALKMGGRSYRAQLGELMEQQEDWVRVGAVITQVQS